MQILESSTSDRSALQAADHKAAHTQSADAKVDKLASAWQGDLEAATVPATESFVANQICKTVGTKAADAAEC
ncbi:hypothetical protein LTR64_004886 [Lithohypha guttulata]|uniref:uncharacterized protein n=1 Tax=Lithohypha guttulata TaxID=1690604 RepID=UPI002DE1EFE1|nr:hypothetical protein LTR51_005277 [Lithohypha guttulata]